MTALRRREQTVIGVAGVIVLAAAVLLLVIFPAIQQVRLAQLEATRKQVEKTRLLVLVDRRAQIETRHRDAAAAARALEARLPREPALPAFVDALGRALQDAGVQLRQISFAQIPPAGGNDALPSGVAAVPVQIQVSGEYRRVRAFIGALEQMPRAVVVDRLAVTGAQRGVLVDLSLRAFYAP
ncbi:MAG TPA: type 4a pilus biogenesis protein PilO [bacterium]|nr:type 4a pilus biogenesis protein PilO [bacterium]